MCQNHTALGLVVTATSDSEVDEAAAILERPPGVGFSSSSQVGVGHFSIFFLFITWNFSYILVGDLFAEICESFTT